METIENRTFDEIKLGDADNVHTRPASCAVALLLAYHRKPPGE